MSKIVIGNDHGAIDIKNQIIRHLEKRNFEVLNMGVDTSDSVDYPDMARITCDEYMKGGYEFGIVCCGTGIGISISANKIKGIRCALPSDKFSAEMAKAHNNVNFIAFGGRMNYQDSVEDMLDIFIDSEYEGGRHQQRIDKMMSIDD